MRSHINLADMASIRNRAGTDTFQFAVIAMAVGMQACHMPVHITQSPHILAYRQQFTLCSDDFRNRFLSGALGINPEFVPRPREVEHLMIQGSAYLRVVSVPGDADSFTVEGHGWHRMYYGSEEGADAGRYLTTADYKITNSGAIALAELNTRSLVLEITVTTTLYAAEEKRKDKTYNVLIAISNSAKIFLKIFLKEVAAKVYTFDYDRNGLVGVPSTPGGKTIQAIGYMQLIDPDDGRNLWDFRRSSLVASDYPSFIRDGALVPHRLRGVSNLEWLPPPSCEHRPAEPAHETRKGDDTHDR